MNVCLLLLAFLAAVCHCQTTPVHAICETPQEWSALFQQILIFDGCTTDESNLGQIYFNFNTNFTRVDIAQGAARYGSHSTTYVVSVYQDFTKQIQYTLDRTTNKCTSQTLDFALLDGPPPNAKYAGEVLIGSTSTRILFPWLI